MPQTRRQPSRPSVALVLAGGGARGAYELGALSVLLPRLAERDELPEVIVGTSVGALNAAYLAAKAHEPIAKVVEEGCDTWRRITYRDVLEPLVSAEGIPRLLTTVGDLAGIPGARMWSLLDPEPLGDTLAGKRVDEPERLRKPIVSFRQIRRNVAAGRLRAAAVVAGSAYSGRSVVFHDGGGSPKADRRRGIDYAATPIREEHVRASAAIPGFFPAVHVSKPSPARGWYFDGGIRINTPIKPAITLAAPRREKRVIILALNSLTPPASGIAAPQRPDAFEGASQLLQAVLVDPLVHDVQTLTTINEVVGGAAAGEKYERIPYILIAPPTRDTVGECAVRVYKQHYAGLRGLRRSRDVAALGRLADADMSPARGELFSYMFFAPEFAAELIELGRRDAEAWLAMKHDIGPWRIRRPPS